jgi:hypothetical protein
MVSGAPENRIMNQRAVRRMTKRRMDVTELNEDDLGSETKQSTQ